MFEAVSFRHISFCPMNEIYNMNYINNEISVDTMLYI